MSFSADQITLWPFCEAPLQYRQLSSHGGDEDWIMVVPDNLLTVPCGHSIVANKIEPLKRAIGICDTSEHRVDGATVFIGAHS